MVVRMKEKKRESLFYGSVLFSFFLSPGICCYKEKVGQEICLSPLMSIPCGKGTFALDMGVRQMSHSVGRDVREVEHEPAWPI